MSPINAYLIKMMTDQQQRDLEAMTAENRRISLARRNRLAALVAGRVPARRRPTVTTVGPPAMSTDSPGPNPVQRVPSEAGGDIDHLDGVSIRTA